MSVVNGNIVLHRGW